MKRKSIISLGVMLLVTLCCALLIPHININSDLTEYLPKDSSMKIGLDSLKANFPFIDTNAPTVRAMFPDSEADDSLAAELSEINGIVASLPERKSGGWTLYTLNASSSGLLTGIQQTILAAHPDAVVETNANSNMPDNMVLILIIGAILVGVILLVMCASFIEAILFIFTIGMAVIMNMGTNAFLPSVSMMTNTIVALLQFVLSMDYSIILMNRYRLVKAEEQDSGAAMAKALKLSRSSILSSSLTTIVGLLALVFMKFRIGLDLGVVLAKGVLFSLISVYTILPGLVLIFEKAIIKTSKRVPVIPTKRLATFEVKFRWALAIAFVGLFAGSWFLQKRTELKYASIWESRIDEVFAPQTNVMVLYRTDEGQKVISLLDTVAAHNPKVVSAVSYHSIMERPMTAEELFSKFESLKEMMPEGFEIPVDSSLLNVGNLKALYYAATHTKRDEKASLSELLACLPAQIDIEKMSRQFMPSEIGLFDEPAAEPEAEPAPEPAAAEVKPTEEDPDRVQDSLLMVSGMVAPVMSVAMAPEPEASEPEVSGTEPGTAPEPEKKFSFTYENVREQLSADAMAEFLQSGSGNARTIYKMAGRKDGTMTAQEFIYFVNTKILQNKMLSSMISKSEKAGLEVVSRQIDSAIAAGPCHEILERERIIMYADSTKAVSGVQTSAALVAAAAPVASEPAPPTPFEELLEMVSTDKKYSARRMGRIMRRAGIDINQEEIDLLFMYYGSQKNYDETTTLSINKLLNFISSSFASSAFLREMAGPEAQEKLNELRAKADEGLGMLRGEKWSFAAIVFESLPESDEVFAFVEDLKKHSEEILEQPHYLIGEPVMYKEMKDGFGHELAVVTLITVLSIFLIVCLSFRSVVIPVILVMAVLTGVYVNVWVSGFGGSKMLYLAYLIVQSILMGATIDYAIVFTNFYRDTRRAGMQKVEAMKMAYKGSINTIMTSGLIMILAPAALSAVMSDPTIKAILSSLSVGALAVSLVIILLLPGTLAACDRIICRKSKKASK